MADRPAASPPGRLFFGQPGGLAYLAFTEAWERFSYYGMTALLTLYLTKSLLVGGRAEHVLGFSGFKAALQTAFGPMTSLALASQIFGLYTAFVYFTPLIGGFIADRWIGRRAAVTLGALLMSAGHIAMAFDASFLFALGLLIVGCGFLKGNISTQVGQLYPETDDAGRTRGFAIFSIGINVGSVLGPVTCGFLAVTYGWHAGFGAAAVMMLVALGVYLTGSRGLAEPPRTKAPPPSRVPGAPPPPGERRVLLALAAVIGVTVFQSIAYYQGANIGLVWIDQYVDPNLLGFRIPTPWFSSVDSLVSIIFVPVLIGLWRWQDTRGGEPGDLGKIGQGALISALGNLVLAAAALRGHGVSPLWPLADLTLQGIGFLYYWPTLLALVSRAAPARLKSTLMGCAFLSLFFSNTLIGRLGGFYESLGPAAFWLGHAALALAGAALAAATAGPLSRALGVGERLKPGALDADLRPGPAA